MKEENAPHDLEAKLSQGSGGSGPAKCKPEQLLRMRGCPEFDIKNPPPTVKMSAGLDRPWTWVLVGGEYYLETT